MNGEPTTQHHHGAEPWGMTPPCCVTVYNDLSAAPEHEFAAMLTRVATTPACDIGAEVREADEEQQP